MGSVKASIRIWVQDSGWWYPPFEDRSKLLPLLPRALTAANQYVTPQSIDAISEDAQLIDVAGDGMVLVVADDAQHHQHQDQANQYATNNLPQRFHGQLLKAAGEIAGDTSSPNIQLNRNL